VWLDFQPSHQLTAREQTSFDQQTNQSQQNPNEILQLIEIPVEIEDEQGNFIGYVFGVCTLDKVYTKAFVASRVCRAVEIVQAVQVWKNCFHVRSNSF